MYYHVSLKYLGKSKILKPRIPRNRMSHEDSITPRVCFSNSIKLCRKAIDISNYEIVYVYKVEKLPGIVKPALNVKKFNKKYKLKYNSNFELDNSVISKLSNDFKIPKPKPHKCNCCSCKISGFDYKHQQINEKIIKKIFTGLVPDAEETKEIWATKPVKVKFIGISQNNQLFKTTDIIKIK